jgi:Acetyltransferase (GNAT) domain
VHQHREISEPTSSQGTTLTSAGGRSVATTYRVDPLRDPRWTEFAERHPRGSVFHTRGWLEALRRTYGYEPVVYTTTPPGVGLANGLVLCRVYSRVTGRRLVSLPFSDHCEPLVDCPDDAERLLNSLKLECPREGLKYIELRPRTDGEVSSAEMIRSEAFAFHVVDLGPGLKEIFKRFHKDSIQRKIRRAEREELTYEEGRSEALLEKFYRLLLRTRRRHQLPPHPRAWFRNLVDCLGEQVKIRVASKDSQPIASIVTLSFKDGLVYKYGCSDERFHHLGGMQLLFWNTIQEGKSNGARELDLGRSDCDNPGLITFKDRWGAERSRLTYWRYPPRSAPVTAAGWPMKVVKRLSPHVPDHLLIAAGTLLYKHIG